MRIESARPAKNGGWLHLLNEAWPRSIEHKIVMPVLVRKLDCDALLGQWGSETTTQVEALASDLRVTNQSLLDLGTCWAQEHGAYAFPMLDENGRVVGIRLRSPDRKWAVKGSKAALFLPMEATKRLSVRMVLICEGPTDTAAALTLGFFAIGRPACLGCEEMTGLVLKELSTIEAVICYDNDAPGIRGAEKLALALPCSVVKFVPPRKDLRTYLAAGGTKEALLSVINNCVRTKR